MKLYVWKMEYFKYALFSCCFTVFLLFVQVHDEQIVVSAVNLADENPIDLSILDLSSKFGGLYYSKIILWIVNQSYYVIIEIAREIPCDDIIKFVFDFFTSAAYFSGKEKIWISHTTFRYRKHFRLLLFKPGFSSPHPPSFVCRWGKVSFAFHLRRYLKIRRTERWDLRRRVM